MLKQISKSIKTKIFVSAIIAVLMVGCITVFAASQHKLIFKDINGDEVTVLTNSQQEFLKDKNIIANTVSPDSEKVKVGQTIQVDGEEAIVFAVGEDGSYITVTPDIYNEFINTNK